MGGGNSNIGDYGEPYRKALAAKNAAQTPTGTSGQSAINQAIPGLPGLTKGATDIINNALLGLPSSSEARLENAYFGAGSGLDPTSDFLRNRGYDLYKSKANERQRGGIQDLLSLIGTYSGSVVPTPGEQLGASSAAASRAQQGAQFNATMNFEREQYQKSLELLDQLLSSPAGGTGYYNGMTDYANRIGVKQLA